MGSETGIQWTDATWNPIRGCSRISPGCENCYAETMAARFSAPGAWAHGFALQGPARWTRKVSLVPSMLELPLRWKKPRRIFVNSMSDLFHESLGGPDIARVFAVMAMAPQHTFQVLTKRAEKMKEMLNDRAFCNEVSNILDARVGGNREAIEASFEWPLRNVWLGASVEDQQRADERISHLIATPAAVRFLSVEPLLGPVSLGEWLPEDLFCCGDPLCCCGDPDCDNHNPIDWVIVGGESGHGARPMRLEWARSIVEQCRAASVPVFVKQLGAQPIDGSPASCGFAPPPGEQWEPVPLRLASKKGGDMDEWPADLRVRQFPDVSR